eukprot:TRINITY_DN341_c2_g2_i1.p1 TRINITY_DN341_c2_g2~~TRINITY_DN341_c2_g2_i1.p1  ORF type:complete len:327 (+),score=87.20 TRINITY_DN341_c2_g2_i1:1147-2127(+)
MSLKRKAERQITSDNPGLEVSDEENEIIPVKYDQEALDAIREERERKRKEELEALKIATSGAFKKIVTSAAGLERSTEKPKKTEEKGDDKSKATESGVAAIDFTAAPSSAPGFPTLETNLAPTASTVGGKKLSFSFSTSENKMAQIAKQAAEKNNSEGSHATPAVFSPLAPAFVSYVEKEKEKQQSVPAVLSPSEQKTGQEEEETILEVAEMHLYQLNSDNSWNERGMGVVKVNKHSNGSHRILMWRDKTHSLLLNESLVDTTFKLTPSSNQRAFTFLSAAEKGTNTFCIKIKKPQNIANLAELHKKLSEILGAKPTEATEEKKTE